MASQPQPSYTKATHNATYPAINPELPSLSNAGRVVVLTGASGGIGRVAATSFAKSKPKALILLGRRADELAKTAELARATAPEVTIETHVADLRQPAEVRAVTDAAVQSFGGIDVLAHCAGVLAPVQPLVDTDPTTLLKGYEMTLVGGLTIAQAVILSNRNSSDAARPLAFLNVTTAGILFPAFPGMGAYVSSKMAAVKLLDALAGENPQVRLTHVHPGFLQTAMSAELAKTTKLPFAYDDISLPADFLVWAASAEADFLRSKIVFAAWDVDELKARKQEIAGSPERPGSGELFLGFKGFPRYIGDMALPGTS